MFLHSSFFANYLGGKARLKHETISFQDIFHVPIEPHSVTKMLTENRGIFHFNNDQIFFFFIKMERVKWSKFNTGPLGNGLNH